MTCRNYQEIKDWTVALKRRLDNTVPQDDEHLNTLLSMSVVVDSLLCRIKLLDLQTDDK